MSEPSAGEHKHRWWWNEDEAVSGDFPFVCEDGCDATIDGVEVLDILNDREALLRDKATLEAKLEAAEKEIRRLRIAVAAREVIIKTERQLAAQQEGR